MAQRKPELLLPAGNVDSFYAALEGGADAVYLGLRDFNARGRAVNFSNDFFLAALREARKRKVKLYVTLNTVIKNSEINSLLDTLSFLEQAGADAIIVQDWGLYHLAHRWFPKLVIHASTQMGNHNSAGVNFSATKGIARVILARELTMKELEKIASNAKTELELFIHGALCYSFSGMCFFSSYLGGRGANRGLCAQPCRMVYKDGGRQKYLFNLKDNYQLPNLEKLISLGINSLKVEGRMKSADYVYRVAKAYRLATDHPEKQREAEELLALDFGREKTAYFLGKDLKNAIAANSNTGIPVGFVQQVCQRELFFESDTELLEGDRVRIRNRKNENTFNTRLQNLKVQGNRYSFTIDSNETVGAGDEIFWVGRKAKALPSKFRNPPQVRFKKLQPEEKKRIRQTLLIRQQPSKPGLFVRIGDPRWLPLLRMDDFDGLIFSLKRKALETFDFSSPAIRQNLHKVHIELPKFIPEGKLSLYRTILNKAENDGIRQFVVSHLSQKLLLPKSAHISTNENVYVYNDAAAKMLGENGVQHFCYPLENDFENLRSMQNKQGIVVLHFYPELFFSRMPVEVNNEGKQFSGPAGKTFKKLVRDGMSIVIPATPVNLFQYKKQLQKEGFTNFMIDLKHEKPSKKTIQTLFEKYHSSEQYQPSGTFNFKSGLK